LSTKWIICSPYKNFKSDCYQTEYGVSIDNTTPQNVDACNRFTVGQCTDQFICFEEPPTQPTGCGTSRTTDQWYIYPNDHFSFVICGAGDDDTRPGAVCHNGDDQLGFDIVLTWFDMGHNIFYNPVHYSMSNYSKSNHCWVLSPCTD
jgi:hypothetical protein